MNSSVENWQHNGRLINDLEDVIYHYNLTEVRYRDPGFLAAQLSAAAHCFVDVSLQWQEDYMDLCYAILGLHDQMWSEEVGNFVFDHDTILAVDTYLNQIITIIKTFKKEQCGIDENACFDEEYELYRHLYPD